jgi:hypothetical protein
VYAALGDIELGFNYLKEYVNGTRGYCGPFMRGHMLLKSLRQHPEFEALAKRNDWPSGP